MEAIIEVVVLSGFVFLFFGVWAILEEILLRRFNMTTKKNKASGSADSGRARKQ